MIKNIVITLLLVLTFSSCSQDDDSNTNLSLKTLPIKEAVFPDEFEFGSSYTVKVTYDLPDRCHSFYNLYYEYDNTSRIVAITALVNSGTNCTQAIIEKEHEFVVRVNQREDYIFRLWKGKDGRGDIFEDVIVPVIN
ncbi:MAG TPA: hypothetical protein DDZ39_12570 [Flavobacteriaceae bacterium]|nr:hypothetical protein [Flavobacteriaceae bacterium]